MNKLDWSRTNIYIFNLHLTVNIFDTLIFRVFINLLSNDFMIYSFLFLEKWSISKLKDTQYTCIYLYYSNANKKMQSAVTILGMIGVWLSCGKTVVQSRKKYILDWLPAIGSAWLHIPRYSAYVARFATSVLHLDIWAPPFVGIETAVSIVVLATSRSLKSSLHIFNIKFANPNAVPVLRT